MHSSLFLLKINMQMNLQQIYLQTLYIIIT